jgi:hypothetical protein
MKFAIGRKQLIVSLSDIATESRASVAARIGQRELARFASRQAFSSDRAQREINAQLNGAARLRTP